MATTKTKSGEPPPPIVPIDDETRAMLDYAASPEGSAEIEQARQEIRDGDGIVVGPRYLDELNERISRRASLESPASGAS